MSPIEIMKLARKGNKKAIKVYQITKKYLEIGLINIIKMLNPEIIVIGGGIANAGKLLFGSIFSRNTKIIKAKFGEDAGAIGAALLFK